jgi:hypothetical protein
MAAGRLAVFSARGKIGAAAWKEIGKTEWVVQTLGFANQPRALEGRCATRVGR